MALRASLSQNFDLPLLEEPDTLKSECAVSRLPESSRRPVLMHLPGGVSAKVIFMGLYSPSSTLVPHGRNLAGLFVLEPFGGWDRERGGSQTLTGIWICSRTALKEVVPCWRWEVGTFGCACS